MILLASDIRAVLWVAVVPAIIAVVVLVLFVREPPSPAVMASNPLSGIGELNGRYWAVVVIGAVFTLARFSEAFLVLRAQDLGMALAMVPIVLVVMNLAYTAIAYQAGLAADKGHRNHLLLWGLIALIAADLVIASSASLAALFAGVVLWGAHMGLTQGLLSALVADTAPAPLRGTAFGVFHLVSGVALLAASVLAGWLWSEHGAAATFAAGAAFAATALAGLVTYMYVSRTRP
jgi:MFS family permease